MWFLLLAINSRPCNNFLTVFGQVCYSSTEPTMCVYNKPFHAVAPIYPWAWTICWVSWPLLVSAHL